MNTLEKIKAELAAFEEKKKSFVAELQKEFPTMFVDLFKQAPKLKSVSWTQYTPYFNDGDTCEFDVHASDLYVNGISEDYGHDDDTEVSIKIHAYKQLLTEEDVHINKEVANKCGLHWYASKGIGERGLCYNEKYDADVANAVKEISEILTSIPEELMKDLFGDHALVTIDASGTIDVEGYEHD
jgi:hypothetical protein